MRTKWEYHKFRRQDIGQLVTQMKKLGKDYWELALSTWNGIRPVTHYSESKEIEGGGEKETPAHSKYIVGPIDTYGHQFDIMVEAKGKELAVARYHLLHKARRLLSNLHGEET